MAAEDRRLAPRYRDGLPGTWDRLECRGSPYNQGDIVLSDCLASHILGSLALLLRASSKARTPVSDFLASDLFRFLVLPLGAAGLCVVVKLIVAAVKRNRPGPDVFSVWIELTVASVLNLLTVATDVAREVGRKLSTCMRHQRQGITGRPPLCRAC
jgi:hypothetical protein